MNSFLYRVAEAYYNRHGAQIDQFTFVFPNRRAGLFFQQYIGRLSKVPLFSPEILTVNDCFQMACPWQLADRLSMLFRIFRIYREQSGSDENFDQFVFWGEMLLSDFEEVDKYRVDARQLFTNVTELKEIDRLFNVFSEKQIEAIREFWSGFIPVTEGKSRENFMATWKILYPIYEQFRNELKDSGEATMGMICRNVADRLRAKETIEAYQNKQFVFIGFNALNPCERTLFAELQKREQADFYWDYDATELCDPDNQASRFYAENLLVFPSKYPIEAVAESLHLKQIELIGVPSAVGQIKQVHEILNDLYPPEVPATNWIRTAVVLPDEQLLIPLLHSFPSQIKKINITMGFPLQATPVWGLIEHIFELQRRARNTSDKVQFYHVNVSNILNHQYIAQLCGTKASNILHKMVENNRMYIEAENLQRNKLLTAIFTPHADAGTFIPALLEVLRQLQSGWQKAGSETDVSYQLECDYIYQYYVTLNRMQDILDSRPLVITMTLDTLIRLIRQLTAGITIPFIGEPLDGLQVMGVLETRGLDFDNLIISSFNEGVFPQKSVINSFIPHNLRRGFDLPTSEYHDAITAYNFYRLIHRASRIHFLYDSRADVGQTGEVSRYLHQLQYHYGVQVIHKNISFDIGFEQAPTICIQKIPEVMAKLQRFCSSDEKRSYLSASALNTYIDCPLQFYMTKVENMQETDEVKETIEADMFGTILHAVMEELYKPFTGHLVRDEDLTELLKNHQRIDKTISLAFAEHYFRKRNTTVPLEGNNLLVAKVIKKYVLRIIEVDQRRTPFSYLGSEEKVEMEFPLSDGQQRVNIKGYIDRVDEKDGRIRILDYKTGAGGLDFRSIDEVFESGKDKRPKFVLQTFLYAILYQYKHKTTAPIEPGIYYLRESFNKEFDTQLRYKPDRTSTEPVTDYEKFKEEFTATLTQCIENIFDPAIPFTQTDKVKTCSYCSYNGVCKR